MVCKQCGANNIENSSYCKLCGAQMLPQEGEQGARLQEQGSSSSAPPASWGFVQPPSWPKPTFDINAVDEMPNPEPAFVPPAQEPPAAAPFMRPESDSAPGPAYQAPYSGAQADYYAPEESYAEQGDSYEDDPGFRPKTIASVGDYDSTGAFNTGNFGRMPRRADYDDQDDSYSSASSRKGKSTGRSSRGSSSGLNRRSGGRRSRGGSSYRGGGNRNTLIFFGAAGLLVVLLVVFAGIILRNNFGGVGGFFRSVFGGTPILKPVTTGEGISDSGNEVWEVTVYARKGNEVVMRVAGQEKADVIGGSNQKLLQIPKEMLVPEEPWDGPTAELAPEVYIKTDKGEEIPVEVPPFTVNVPALNLQVTTPQGSAIAVSRSKVTFAGTVNDGSVAVTVQGQPLTVEADGRFTGEYDVGAVGSHSLTVEAKKAGYQIARATFQVDYTQSQAYIDVDRGSIRASADGDVANVKGKVKAGATITATCADSRASIGTPSVDGEGNFSFSVTMSEIGAYTIDVSISQDGRTSSGIIVVERAPVLKTYSESAYKVNYARMMDEPTHAGSYRCIGTVTEVIQDEPFHIARLQTSDGDIIFEYHNNAAKVEVGDGMTYNVFGDYIGKDEETGLPLVYGWFIIKQE